uniref:Uncharacterized protein n=1 Tax=Octopus bimaculoides TaxID=37653 RepID=A0A0L8FS68_OCTBM
MIKLGCFDAQILSSICSQETESVCHRHKCCESPFSQMVKQKYHKIDVNFETIIFRIFFNVL